MPDYQVPDQWQDTVENKGKNIKVNINATIDASIGTKYSVYHVKGRMFTQEEADRYVAFFTKGQPFYTLSHEKTKTDLENEIIELNKEIALYGDSKDDNGVKLSEKVKSLRKKLKDAPDMAKKELASKKFVSYKDGAGRWIAGCMEDKEHGSKELIIDNGCFGSLAKVVYNRIPNLINDYEVSDEFLKALKVTPIKLSERDAKKTVEQTLQTLNIKDFAIVSIQKAYATKDTDKENAIHPLAWSVTCVRKINALPIKTADIDQGCYFNRDFYKSCYLDDTSTVDLEENKEDDYAEEWEEEKIQVLVDDTGILAFEYESPYTIEEELSKTSNLLAFSNVESIFKKMIIYKNESENNSKYDLNVKNVKLELKRIVMKNKRQEGMLIPVWNFYGSAKVTGDIEYESKNDTLLMINAIDGSIVN